MVVLKAWRQDLQAPLDWWERMLQYVFVSFVVELGVLVGVVAGGVEEDVDDCDDVLDVGGVIVGGGLLVVVALDELVVLGVHCASALE
jgi:hypothetical protein